MFYPSKSLKKFVMVVLGIILLLSSVLLLAVIKQSLDNPVPTPNTTLKSDVAKVFTSLGERYCTFKGGLKSVYISPNEDIKDFMVICNDTSSILMPVRSKQ